MIARTLARQSAPACSPEERRTVLARNPLSALDLPEVSVSDDGEVRHLHLGTPWIQGSMRVAAPFDIELEYVQRMMAWLLFV